VALQKAEEGIGLLAARAGCPVIPVHVQGTSPSFKPWLVHPRRENLAYYYKSIARRGNQVW
jgi:hypothetical protein